MNSKREIVTEATAASEPSGSQQRVVGPAPDCCSEWTRSVAALDGFITLGWTHGMKYTGKPFAYCPWCGRARPNMDSTK